MISNEKIKQLIIEGARKYDCLGDWCVLVEYDPDIGKIKPRWEPCYDIFHACFYVLHSLETSNNQATSKGKP